jgi:hypothetical protein
LPAGDPTTLLMRKTAAANPKIAQINDKGIP